MLTHTHLTTHECSSEDMYQPVGFFTLSPWPEAFKKPMYQAFSCSIHTMVGLSQQADWQDLLLPTILPVNEWRKPFSNPVFLMVKWNHGCSFTRLLELYSIVQNIWEEDRMCAGSLPQTLSWVSYIMYYQWFVTIILYTVNLVLETIEKSKFLCLHCR